MPCVGAWAVVVPCVVRAVDVVCPQPGTVQGEVEVDLFSAAQHAILPMNCRGFRRYVVSGAFLADETDTQRGAEPLHDTTWRHAFRPSLGRIRKPPLSTRPVPTDRAWAGGETADSGVNTADVPGTDNARHRQRACTTAPVPRQRSVGLPGRRRPHDRTGTSRPQRNNDHPARRSPISPPEPPVRAEGTDDAAQGDPSRTDAGGAGWAPGVERAARQHDVFLAPHSKRAGQSCMEGG